MGDNSKVSQQGRAAVLVIDNAQGIEINDEYARREMFNECLAENGFPLNIEVPAFKIPATVLNAIGWAIYYPLLTKKYDDVYVVIGKDKAEFTDKLKRSTDRFGNVDVFVMAHTNLNDGETLAGAPTGEIAAALTAEERSHLGLIYSMGCRDGREYSALSMRIMGFKSFVGHKGVSANYLVTKDFLERWLSGDADLKQASTAAYNEARSWVERSPAWAWCLLTPGFTPYAEVDGMETALYGANVMFGQAAVGEDVNVEDMLRDLKKPYDRRVENPVCNAYPEYTDLITLEMRSKVGEYINRELAWKISEKVFEYLPQSVQDYKFELAEKIMDMGRALEFCVTKKQEMTVPVLAQYISSERLIQMAADDGFPIKVRWLFVEALKNKSDAEMNLRKIIEDVHISMPVRKKALSLYMSSTDWSVHSWDAIPLIKGIMCSEQTEPDMLYAAVNPNPAIIHVGG